MSQQQKFLNFHLNFLRTIGFSTDYTPGFSGIFARTLLYSNLMNILVSFVLETFYIIDNILNIFFITDAAVNYLLTMFGVVKVVSLYSQRKSVAALRNKLESLLNRVDSDEVQSVMQSYGKMDKINKYYLALCFLAVFIMGSKSVVMWIVYSTREFPLKILFIIDLRQSPIYELILANNLISLYFLLIGHMIIDCLFFSLAILIVAHLRILQNRLKSIKYEFYQEAEILIPELVTYHYEIIECCGILNRIYFGTLLFQLFSAASNMCMVVMQLLMINEPLERLMIIFMAIGLFSGLFFYDFCGNQIVEESLRVSDAIYQSEWELAPPKIRRDIILLMMRSQKRLIIRVGFYKVTLEAFIDIMKTAHSIFTLTLSLF